MQGGEGSGDGPFEFELDRAGRFLRITIRGVWKDADFPPYAAQLRTMAQQLNALGASMCLVDAQGMQLQSQSMTDRHIELISALADEGLMPDRMAFVIPDGLLKLQGKRVTAGIGMQYFSTVADAEQWLRA